MKNIIIILFLSLIIKSLLLLFQNIYHIINITNIGLVSKLKTIKFSVTYKEEEEIRKGNLNGHSEVVNNSTSSGGNSQFNNILGFLSPLKFYLIWSSLLYSLILLVSVFIAYLYYRHLLSNHLLNLEFEFAKDIINNINCSRYHANTHDLFLNHHILSERLFHTHDIAHFSQYIQPTNDSIICLQNVMQSSPDLSSKVTVSILQNIITEHSANILELPQTIAHTTILATIPLITAITLACLISILELASASTMIVN